ncbi:YigZ family protein [Halanaerobacter jeridensis]|uniref:YigZ family protein n=1 Tax=Halanaerobacter jeridensis TaxID=706427 RepID=A0A939BRR4_9FIRM|nr:YigZ family protein [Halanaerobacter jeridensis]MBM7556296.1 putative YigZ family protein [Halanaerobacter jeridensis]
MDSYKTIAQDTRIQRKIKKCKFITSIKNVTTVRKAEEFIADISEEFADATHNVYAFKVGLEDKAITRSSDDGEPSGSSGPPALKAIEGRGLTNTVVVVTRYFGGVKHGVGGLIRAYGDSVREAIDEAGIIKKTRYIKLAIEVSYDMMGQVINDLEGSEAKVENTEYTNEGVRIIAVMKPSLISNFKARIKEETKGESEFEELEEVFV